jgi:primosomal protein N' (replication factor Y)
MKLLSGVVCARPQASESQILLASWIAGYYASGPASSAHAVFPAWLGNPRRLLVPPPAPSGGQPEVTIALTSPDTSVERVRSALIRTRGQVLVLVPERTVLTALAERLADLSPLVVHGALGVVGGHRTHAAAANGTPRLILGTRSALFLPLANLIHILVEDANNDAYKSESAPRFYAPEVARKLAELHGASLTLMVPSLSAVQRRLTAARSVALAEEKPYWPAVALIARGVRREVLSPESLDALDRTLAEGGRALIVSPRRGWSGSLRCAACRKAVPCKTCLLPMRVHEPAPAERMLVCYHCGSFENFPRFCPSCRHGPLSPAGLAGSQRIAAEVRRMLQRRDIRDAEVAVYDTDLQRTARQQETAAHNLERLTSGIVVASQLILPYRWRMRFSLVVVAEADALAWHPDFRSHERLVSYLEKLADFLPDRMIVEHADSAGALVHATERSWNDFLDAELASRKSLRWPPFVRLASVTVRDPRRASAVQSATLVADRLRRAAAHLGIAKRVMVSDALPSLSQRAGGRWTSTVLVRTDITASRLSELLSFAPTGTIDVDPRSIL